MAQKYIVGDVVMYDNKIMVVKEPRDGSHFDLSCPKEDGDQATCNTKEDKQ